MIRLLRDEDGQAMFWGVGVIIILVVLFFGAMDVGQLVLGKIQSQNAADGAALSAASLKASVHNTRVLAYRAASGQLTLTRLQLMRASAAAFAEIDKPGGANQKLYKEAFKEARGHRYKMEKLRSGIIAFNTWATKQPQGAQFVRQAAEVGYLGNIGSLGTADPGNMSLFNRDDALAENDRSFGNKIIGGVTYSGEALSPTGSAGKSYVRITPKVGAFGSAWLAYSGDSTLKAASAAGPLLATDVYGKNSSKLKAVSAFGINWYTVRLLPIREDPTWDKN